MLRRTFLAMFGVLAMAASANAGTLYTFLVIDPATTAGAGVPAASSFVVNSSRSGAGTWHLFAVDDTDGSNGLRSFFVKLNGNILASNARSPVTSWDTDPTFGDGTVSVAGFDSNRTTVPGSTIFGASQGNTVNPAIGGFGIEASNFLIKTGGLSYAPSPTTTSGQWGLYSAADGLTSGIVGASGHVRNALFLGEGTYTGAAPTVDITTGAANGGTIINSWNAVGFPGGGSFSTASDTTLNTLSNQNPFFVIPEPATLSLLGLAMVGGLGLRRRRS